jgi:hypothetical protein
MLFQSAQAEESGWRSLPLVEDGQVAPGWTQIGWGKFVVDGDSLRTECDERGLGVLLYEQEKFGDCQIRIVFKPEHARSNSGVHVRIDDGILDWRGKETFAVKREADGSLSDEMMQKLQSASERRQGPWYAVHHGYEIQICDSGDAMHHTGAVYSLAKTSYEPPEPADRWRTMVVTLQGNLVLIEIDGQQVTQFDPDSPDVPPQKQWYEPSREAKRPTTGYFGLQTHDPGDVVYFKEVSVRPLP